MDHLAVGVIMKPYPYKTASAFGYFSLSSPVLYRLYGCQVYKILQYLWASVQVFCSFTWWYSLGITSESIDSAEKKQIQWQVSGL